SDVRWLREQALREEWKSQGFFKKLGGLTERGTRETVNKALEARAKDEPGELSGDDAAALDRWLDERPPLPPARIESLAQARLEPTETLLREDHGIEGTRLRRGTLPTSAAEGAPLVKIQLGTK